MLINQIGTLLTDEHMQIIELMSMKYEENEIMALKNYVLASVLEVKHYTDTLFSFRTKRSKKIRFKSGGCVTMGLIIRGKLVFRNYYVCSPTWDNKLEFYSMVVPNGLFTSFLKMITTRSSVIIMKKMKNGLIMKALSPGKRLFLLCTDIGIAVVSNIISEPETYAKFNEVIVVMVCKYVGELQYFDDKLKQLATEPQIKPYARNKLRFYRSVTHEPYPYSGDLTWLIKSGTLIADLMTYTFDKMDRFMICGSQQTTLDVTNLLKVLGYNKGTANNPQDFAYERQFVNKLNRGD
ncbi:Ferredoxin--NADP reductase [Candidatus Hodgkinia cicadicola]|nr:Ferredoxin--NADP reductase [Candidatus Hodgkinia cicadicola]PIM96285.1 Ferredoxin--NADP reductase [Candidatus Hodgkinia cicadicola]